MVIGAMQERMLLNKNKLLRVKGKRKEETPDSDECLKINGLRDNWDEARMLLKGKTVIALFSTERTSSLGYADHDLREIIAGGAAAPLPPTGAPSVRPPGEDSRSVTHGSTNSYSTKFQLRASWNSNRARRGERQLPNPSREAQNLVQLTNSGSMGVAS
jgi:hypothetical protein